MKPAVGAKTGSVLLCCCIPRGTVTLNAAFDRSAYMAGEVAQIRAGIKNDSEQNVQHMRVKLMRFITLRSSNGHVHTQTDCMAQNAYPGVELHSEATRDLPLALVTNQGNILPGTKARLVDISYRFDVECDLSCAPDIEVHLPVVIFAPQPATWGLAALGMAVPSGIHFDFPIGAPAVAAMPMPMPVPMPMMQQPVPLMIQQPVYNSSPQGGSVIVNNPSSGGGMSPQVPYVPQQAVNNNQGYGSFQAPPPQQQQQQQDYQSPQNQGGYPPQNQGAYPPQQQQQQQQAYPPQQQAYPPQQQQQAYPPQQMQQPYNPAAQVQPYPPSAQVPYMGDVTKQPA